MSIATLSSLWTQAQNAAAAQTAGSGTTSQNAQDWLNSLLSATGTPASTGGTSSTATLSDQMQALLVQLQGGNTVAPDAGGGTTASGTAASPTEATSAHHHHHHHGGTDAIDQSTNDDIASDAAGGLTGGDATGLDSSSGSFMQTLKDVLTTVGSAAVKGAAAGAVMAAI